ncbi:metal-dependent transcriptional regulator [Emticicia sp. SJ17W-69]|uniref:metal-dependent transcriptional regulator n=1 Tax=Emticicia sp. SJ17W-69 TaxID=3421657 RepID=UPI003EBF6D07
MISFTEENYLKIIYLLTERNGGNEVSTNELAEHTQTKAASVSDMLRKLAEKSYINYRKYQGVTLTVEGQQIALAVIRKHRLWEVFLVEKLGFGWDEIHDIAEQLEHIDSKELTESLDKFLGSPKFDPHGDPIPDAKGKMPSVSYQKLSEVPLNQSVVMMGVSVHSPAFLQHLDKHQITLGCSLKVLEISEFDKSFGILLNENTSLFVSNEVARNLLVKAQNA